MSSSLIFVKVCGKTLFINRSENEWFCFRVRFHHQGTSWLFPLRDFLNILQTDCVTFLYRSDLFLVLSLNRSFSLYIFKTPCPYTLEFKMSRRFKLFEDFLGFLFRIHQPLVKGLNLYSQWEFALGQYCSCHFFI